MSSKRGRRESQDVGDGTAPKKPRRAAAAQQPSLDQVRLCQEIFDALRSHKTAEGRNVCDTFMKAPSRRSCPDYYKAVTNPIDLARIQQKIKTDEYDSVELLAADVALLVNNAKTFFKRASTEYRDATELWDAFQERRARQLDVDVLAAESAVSRDVSPSPSARSARSTSPSRSTRSKEASPGRFCVGGADPVDRSVLEELLVGVVELSDDTSRILSPPFRLLPCREEYPEYYVTIKDPIDLKSIAQHIVDAKYRSLNDIEKDLILLCRNAKIFNEPGSMINKDATEIRKYVAQRKAELLESAMAPVEKGRAQHNALVLDELLSQTVAEDGGAELSEDSDEDDEQPADPHSTLYWLIRNYADAVNPAVLLCEAFCQLPSRNWYPDYYDEVKDPMSLYLINKKMKRGMYTSLKELVDDVNLMFENAKSYNIEGSEIYENAARLQAIANKRAKLMDPSLDLSQYAASDTAYDPPRPSATGTPVSSSKRRAGGGEPGQKGRPGRKTLEELMQRYRDKLMLLYNAIYSFREPQRGLWLAENFVNLPSEAVCPQYYQVIDEPMCLEMVRGNIDCDRYDTSAELASDVALIFENARRFYERGSGVYQAADTLDAVFHAAIKNLGPVVLESPKMLKEKFGWSKTRAPGGPTMRQTTALPAARAALSSPACAVAVQSPAATQRRALSAEQRRLWQLYEAVREFINTRGRRLSSAFQKLPSRADYPDYYEVIRKPVDMMRIYNRLMSNQYESLDTLVQDLHLMFDNACRYNEPDSTIYKDALSLQKVLLQKKAELCGGVDGGCGVPDVQAAVQEMLATLFITVFNHQDADGRCYSDSLGEIKDFEENDALLTLDRIKRWLDKGRYRRLDRFQDDLFQVLDHARHVSRSDSQLFEDAVELQLCFIRTRDELCKRGEQFMSPALHLSERHFASRVDAQRKEKQASEQRADAAAPADEPNRAPSKPSESDESLDAVDVGGVEYAVGDFAYVRPADDAVAELHIMRVERVWADPSQNEQFVAGNWFYRPHETFHLATRKFLEKEVFKSVYHDTVVANRLAGRCYVMFVRDYFKFKPKGFDPKDVYVCESRYLGRQLHFKKIKAWPFDTDDGVELVERDEALPKTRVRSVFADAAPPTSAAAIDDVDDDDDNEPITLLSKEREEVPLGSPDEDGAQFYEQLSYNGVWLKLGDGVLTSNPEKQFLDIVRIDKLWRSVEGDAFASGPWFARPAEMEHEPTRMFVRNEVFGVQQPDSRLPLTRVVGRAAVLSLKDYSSMRPTEVREADVFVCQHRIAGTPGSGSCSLAQTERALSTDHLQVVAALEGAVVDPTGMQSPPPVGGAPMSESSARRLKHLKAYRLSDGVLDDEILYFRKPIILEKEPSPLLMKADTSVDVDALSMPDFNDSGSEADASDLGAVKDLQSWLATQPKLNSRSKSGYILFSAEIRKRIMHENPQSTFGEVSKMVGVEWKKLGEDEKKQFESRAQLIADERERADALAGPPAAQRPQPGQIRVFCCRWQGCDYQLETSDQLYDHITTAHTSQIMEGGENQFVCLWMSCAKYRKDGKPFPSLPRLHRHIKEKHMSSAGKCIFPNQRSKHYVAAFPQTAPTPHSVMSATAGGYHQQQAHHTPATPYAMPAASHSAAYPHMQQGFTPMRQQGVVSQSTLAQGHMTPGGGQAVQGQMSTPQLAAVAQPSYANADPGKTVVSAPSRPAEPVFVAPPPDQKRINRVLHSEIYLRYIESMYGDTEQQSVSKWDRSLSARVQNTAPTGGRPLPTDWIRPASGASQEDVVRALWNLRDQMLRDTLNISRVLDHSEL